MKAVVSFANERGNYLKGLKRLEESLKKYDNNTFYGLVGEGLVGSPYHLDNPYAFKVYSWKCVMAQGFKKILWLDASVVAVDNLQPIWDKIDQDGYIMQYAGHLVGNWCNERTLKYFGITREEALQMPMYGNAGFLGLDLDNPIAKEFFDLWEKSMLDGQFIGSWQDHRHDMTCGSIIANKLGMKMVDSEQWLHYAPANQQPKSNVMLHASGL